MDHHHVETGIAQTDSRCLELPDHLVHLRFIDFLEDVRVHIRCQPGDPSLATCESARLGDSTSMQNLARDGSPIAMHLLSQSMQSRNIRVTANREAAVEVPRSTLVDRGGADRHHANARSCLRAQKFNQRFGNFAIRNACMPRYHRGEHQAVLQLDIPNLHRGENVWVIVKVNHRNHLMIQRSPSRMQQREGLRVTTRMSVQQPSSRHHG